MNSPPQGAEAQPLSQVRWLKTSELHANDYNPNHVAPNELDLLKTSILSSGWTQPIVARPDGEIVDGFHRWTVASTDKKVAALTDGLVPVVTLPDSDDRAEQMAATVRHNRARGSHYVLRMADIAASLIDEHGLTPEDLEDMLGMEDEEVERLLDRGRVTKRHARADGTLGKAWAPGERKTITVETDKPS